ncbi:MAG: MalY/PatB family protein [Lactovum sp.]
MSSFDQIIDRKNSQSLKYDFAVERGKPEEVLPFWVADMDFQSPDVVLSELHKSVEHGIFGYSEVKEDYHQAVITWFQKYFSYELKKDWLVKTPGLVFALSHAIKAFSQKGEAVLIQPPVYYPFFEAIEANERKLITNPLSYQNGKYYIDFKDFEAKIVKYKVKLFILCSPHNPVGRVYKKEELQKLGDICLKYQVLVISDEIHCDLALNGHQHYLFPSIDERFLDHTVLLTSASKTFNIAGLQVSNVFIANQSLREKFEVEILKSGYSQLNSLGLVATKACYEKAEAWFLELKVYLEGNYQYLKEFLNKKMPLVKLVDLEGTYLAWLDFSAFNLSDEEINNRIIYQAKLWLDNGKMFGKEGEYFQRINIACPREQLKIALENLASVF